MSFEPLAGSAASLLPGELCVCRMKPGGGSVPHLCTPGNIPQPHGPATGVSIGQAGWVTVVTQTCGPLHLAACQHLPRQLEIWTSLFLPWTPVSLTPVGPRDHILGWESAPYLCALNTAHYPRTALYHPGQSSGASSWG